MGLHVHPRRGRGGRGRGGGQRGKGGGRYETQTSREAECEVKVQEIQRGEDQKTQRFIHFMFIIKPIHRIYLYSYTYIESSIYALMLSFHENSDIIVANGFYDPGHPSN